MDETTMKLGRFDGLNIKIFTILMMGNFRSSDVWKFWCLNIREFGYLEFSIPEDWNTRNVKRVRTWIIESHNTRKFISACNSIRVGKPEVEENTREFVRRGACLIDSTAGIAAPTTERRHPKLHNLRAVERVLETNQSPTAHVHRFLVLRADAH